MKSIKTKSMGTGELYFNTNCYVYGETIPEGTMIESFREITREVEHEENSVTELFGDVIVLCPKCAKKE